MRAEQISIRSGAGLGDSLYLQSIARHLVEAGHQVEVCAEYHEVFAPLAGKITLSPRRRDRITRLAHYTARKGVAGTDQFQDMCISAGITEPVDLRLDWTPKNPHLIKRVLQSGKPLVVVQLPRSPMARTDGYGDELLPDCRVIQRAIDMIGDRAFKVQVGSGTPLFELSGLDLDLAGQTSVSDLIDVMCVAHGALGYCSFIIPLAESFSKPALLVWSRRGTVSQTEYLRSITPQKILHRPMSRAVFDDRPDHEIAEAVHAFLG